MSDTHSNRRNRRFIDLAGQRFGKWTVVDEAVGYRPPLTYWNVLCDCGKRGVVPGPAMRRGRSSCCTSCRVTSHGKSNSPEYMIWRGMRSRCANPSHKQYADYGERGITICAEWDSFDVFYADMGQRPSPKHTLERKDNNLGYSKDNCKWATWEEQSRNKRSNRLITAFGKTQCLVEWSTETGLHVKTISNRIDRGWTVERALTQPV
jgi:hypothetical protein